MRLLTAALLIFWLSLAYAQGGEGDNTGCEGQGNPNSPCDPGNGNEYEDEYGEETGQTQTQEATATSTSSSESSSESVSGAESYSDSASYAEGGAGGAGGEGGAGGAADASATGGNATATGGIGEGGDASSSANNEGITIEGDTYSSKSTNTNVVLVPNNNTSNCMRVFGLSFGASGGAGGLGYPHRDKSCDFEQAADDAAATGDHDIAWFWRCHKRHLYSQFDGRKDQKIMACYERMTQLMEPMVPAATHQPVTEEEVVIPVEEYENLLLAQVQQEEIELLEDKFVQQQSLIEELKEEIEDHEEDQEQIEQLKREAARLREEQEAKKQEELKVQQKFKERLRAKEDE